ncbi:MAG: NADH-quinone oxidoreductase subunit M [Gemmataceae bacterium]|nr:NADH-quinone oxidoreductase subunit M [Gemmataceae bacterium]
MNVPLETLRVLLIVLLALPAGTAVVVALLGAQRLRAIRALSLAATLATLAVAVVLTIGFAEIRTDPAQAKTAPSLTFRPEVVPGALESEPHRTSWNLIPVGPRGAIQFYVGLDGLNVWLVVLTALLMVPSVLVSWNAIQERGNEYYAWLLALEASMLGVFVAFDIILFYVFFELTLVPLFFLIGIWGGPERRYAARKFFLYTLAGSLITLLGVLAAVLVCWQRTDVLTFSIPQLVGRLNLAMLAGTDGAFWQSFQFWLFLALIVGFSVKVPLVPVHTWLPLAHTEAPTAGSVLLAGVLLKVGTYGFLRLAVPLAPDAALTVGVPLIGTLAVIGIIYGAFCALTQDDIKKLVAYSSVSHLGFAMLGMFALNQAGLAGSLLQMLNHGLSTGALFLLVGMLYERYHTRKIVDYGGMGARLGLLATAFVFVTLSSIGLPGLNGFVGEALVFLGMFQVEPVLAGIGTSGILFGAWYMLTLVKRVFCGPVKEPHHEGERPVGDLNLREWFALGPIMVLCVVVGVYPQPILDTARDDLAVVERIVHTRRTAAGVAEARGQTPVPRREGGPGELGWTARVTGRIDGE